MANENSLNAIIKEEKVIVCLKNEIHKNNSLLSSFDGKLIDL